MSFTAVVALYWMLSGVSDWLVVDSYALQEFPKVHPFLGFVASFVWVLDSFGGRYGLIAALVVVWWLVVGLQNRERAAASRREK